MESNLKEKEKKRDLINVGKTICILKSVLIRVFFYLSNKIKQDLFQAMNVCVLLCRCTTRTLTKRPEKKLHGNYLRKLHAVMKKFRIQHLTKQQLSDHLLPISQTILVRRIRYARTNLLITFLHGLLLRDSYSWTNQQGLE